MMGPGSGVCLLQHQKFTALHPFLSGGGEAATIIANFNWSSTSLGTIEAWPASLKASIALILRSPVPIVTLWNEDGIMIYNDAYSQFAGGRHPSLFGSKVREGWPEVADFNDNVMKVGLSGGTLAYRDQAMTLSRNGAPEQVWMDLDYSPLLDESGKPAGVMAIVVETTEKIRAQKELSSEREGLRRMFEQAPGFIAVVSGPDHVFTMANDAYAKLIGHRELLGRSVRQALPEVGEQGFIDLLDQVYRTGQPFVGRGAKVDLQQSPGGKSNEYYLDFVYQPILTDGQTSGIFIQGHDVTEARLIENAIRNESRKLQVLNESGAAIAAELDVGKIVQIVTDACTELVGAQFGAFFYNVINEKGESYMLYALSGVPRAAFSSFPMPRNTEVFEPTFMGQGVVRSDDILRDPRYGKNSPYSGMPKGHLPVRSYLAVPVTSRNGEVIGGLFFGHAQPGKFVLEHEELLIGISGQAATAIDNGRLFQAAEREVAERRRAETALQTLNATLEQRVLEEVSHRTKAEQQLRQIQKMEAVGQLTGGIAHDFNNMLAVILGGLTLMKRKLAKGELDVERFADGAIEGAQRAAALTQRLLAFSRQQPLAPEPLSANVLVSGMSDLLSRTLGEQINIQTVLAAGLWQILADRVQLENAIINLSVNGRDAMPAGGKLTIETSNAYVDDAFAKEFAIAPGQYVLIAVADTGSGMSPDVLAKAFDPFYTTKEVGKGTGLGLSQVYGFVRQSGGHVKIYSEIGLGTTAKIYLPRHHGGNTAQKVEAPLPVVRGSRREVIMVVEDEDRVRAVSVEALKELGYAVVEVSGPLEALRLLQSGQEVHVLFTDVVMPDMSGRQLADRAREMNPDLKILYTTGYTRNAIVHNGILDAGTNLLTKPFTIEELASKVRAILDT
jgi:PAS domain S-box-containing protein